MSMVCQKVTSAAISICFFILASASVGHSQIDQKIWYQYCVASPDSTCFNPASGLIDSVGMDVAELGGDFVFCLELDTVDSGYAPLRVILVLDNSGSMCTHYGADNCCVEGDGSGFCSMNDSANMRVEAAHQFVDNLRAISPESEVGVIIYSSTPTRVLRATSLVEDQDVANIHTAIDRAGCSNSTRGTTADVTTELPPTGLAKTTATKATNLGLALEMALVDADYNFASIPSYMQRHIILLTDGAWDDVTSNPPLGIIQEYRTANPTRTIPTVHGVFISDSLTHVTHGYPAEGCAANSVVELSNLNLAADSTGGYFFGGTTPQTVVNTFLTLLDSVTRTMPEQLISFKVTNTKTGGTSAATTTTIRQIGNSANWEATIPSLALDFGSNPLSIEYTINRFSKPDTTVTLMVTVIRSTQFRETLDKDLFKLHCELKSATIKITATPETQSINLPVDVSAIISNAQNFSVSEVKVRLFTKFPDGENGVLATFHLDGNLNNATNPNDNGTGTPQFTTTAPLFGSGALSGGSFDYSLPAINDAFLLEEWIKPTSGAQVLMSGGGIEFGIDANGKLYLKNEAGIITTAAIGIDAGAWSHVGVARQDGYVVLFVNGIAVSEPIAYTTPLAAGKLTIYTPNKWIVDEVRINNVSRMTMDGTTRTLVIPTLDNTTWTLLEAPSQGSMLTVPTTAWTDNGTKLALTFAVPVAGTVVVNVRQNQLGPSVGTGWSKNGNPVVIISDIEGPYIIKAILTPVQEGNLDTLLIKFSEAVLCTSLLSNTLVDASFEFFTGSNYQPEISRKSEYLVKTCTSNDAIIQEITITVPKGLLDPGRDSARLVGDAVDLAGNKPQDIKAPIEWGAGRNIAFIPSPTEPGLVIPTKVRDDLGITINTGKVIQIETKGIPLLPMDTIRDTISYGKAYIYDPVGNLVASDKNIVESDIPRVYYVLWDGINRNGRRVGAGAYYLQTSFRYIDGQKGSSGVKFRIRWK